MEYIKLCDDKKEQVQQMAKKVLFLAIKVPSVVAIGPLMEIPAMAHLKAKDGQAKELVDLFVQSSIKDFCGKLDTVSNLKEQGVEISRDEALLKKQYILICSIDKKKAHTYEELAQILNIKPDDVEEWTFEAISNGLLDAKVDQLARQVVICSHQFQHVGKNEWEAIQKQVGAWRGRFEMIQKML